MNRARQAAAKLRSLADVRRSTAYDHRRHVARNAYGDVRRAALESDRAICRCARAFGKNDQVAAGLEGSDTFLHELGSGIVADIVGSANRRVREGVAPNAALNDAIDRKSTRLNSSHG